MELIEKQIACMPKSRAREAGTLLTPSVFSCLPSPTHKPDHLLTHTASRALAL